MTKLPSKFTPDYQDEFFLNLDRILVPIGGKKFECTGLELAFYIAHEYGSHLDLLHIGSDPGDSIKGYLEKLAKYEIEHDLVIRKGKNIPREIIEYW